MGQRNQKSVLFLCTGNYYRSRFAEVVFNAVAKRMGLSWRASSGGLALERGGRNVGPMAASAIEALEGRGIRPDEAWARLPVQVTASDLEKADWIVALKDAEHRPLLLERFPSWADKAEYWHVDDAPEALTVVEREVMDLIARLLGGKTRGADDEPSPPEKSRPAPTARPREKPVVRVGRETKGRRGKGVTTVFDLPLDDDGIRELAAKLKQRCGTGGTVKEGRIEIQGDQRDRLIAELEALGYRVKRAGG